MLLLFRLLLRSFDDDEGEEEAERLLFKENDIIAPIIILTCAYLKTFFFSFVLCVTFLTRFLVAVCGWRRRKKGKKQVKLREKQHSFM